MENNEFKIDDRVTSLWKGEIKKYLIIADKNTPFKKGNEELYPIDGADFVLLELTPDNTVFRHEEKNMLTLVSH